MGFTRNYIRNIPAVMLRRQPRRPLLFSYYITHRCTFNCVYCCDGDGSPFKADRVDELSTDDAKELITLLRRDADTLDLTGGEPLLRDDLEELLQHARTVGMDTILNTKGLGIPERPDILEYADTVIISLDSLDADTMAGLTCRTAAAAAEHVGLVQTLMHRAKDYRARLAISCVATPGNLADIQALAELAGETGTGFHVSPEIQGMHVNPALRNNNQYRAAIDSVIAGKKKGYPVFGNYRYLKGIREFRDYTCYPLLMPVIRPDGRLYYPCLEFKQADVSILKAGSYRQALADSVRLHGKLPDCRGRCHIFCHMGLSLLQRHPLAASAEMKSWERT